MSERSIEANKLDADLSAGRLMAQALWQAQQAYHFSPSTYTYESLQAMHRLRRQLETILRPMAGEDADRSSSPSPQQPSLL